LVFEAESLGDVQAFQQERFDREVVHTRVDVIREAIEQCQRLKEVVIGPDVSWNYDLVHYSNLEGYAAEPSRLSALIHFSCFPLTQLHDETVFIRVLHGSEFCFFGIRLCLTAAIEYIKRGSAVGAEEELRQAVMFATMLHRLLKILKTMPPEHFADFRDYTGKASALQSKSYHELDIYLRGVNTAKAEHFKGVPHLKILLRYADPRFVSLKSALNMRQDSEAGWAGVFESAQALDRQLLTWRGLHLSFAKIYIPSAAPGTGGTSGAAYLKQHLGAGLFDDTVPDWDIVREIFPEDNELPGMLRAKSRLSISPDEELLAGADGMTPADGHGS
jgi:tryptophan 2,3-dioxygenase